MPDLRESFVAVGVTDSLESRAAVQYAVQAAVKRRTILVVVHAADTTEPKPTRARRVLPEEEPDELVARVLSTVEVPPSLTVRSLVSTAPAGELLRRIAGQAGLLVLGRHRFQLSDLQLGSSVVSAVAAQSRCPVVVTPAAVRYGDHPGQPVAVAVEAGGQGEEARSALLRVAFAEAELRATSLTVVQALPSHLWGTRWEQDASSVEDSVNRERAAHPRTAVRVVRSTAPTVESLVDQSRLAAALVVERSRHHGRVVSWKRSTTHALLDRTQCPLLVVPQDALEPAARVDARVLVRNGC